MTTHWNRTRASYCLAVPVRLIDWFYVVCTMKSMDLMSWHHSSLFGEGLRNYRGHTMQDASNSSAKLEAQIEIQRWATNQE